MLRLLLLVAVILAFSVGFMRLRETLDDGSVAASPPTVVDNTRSLDGQMTDDPDPTMTTDPASEMGEGAAEAPVDVDATEPSGDDEPLAPDDAGIDPDLQASEEEEAIEPEASSEEDNPVVDGEAAEETPSQPESPASDEETGPSGEDSDGSGEPSN
ncbi:MAG: hypothetical protein AAF668_08340 [Pseudomonadota bacterium]